VGCCVPIITREGKFQRTKHASAILKILELEELIANSEQEYVSLVEKVVMEPKYLNYVKSKIRLRERFLYANEAPIRALENFFDTVAERT
jgi:protein O-GlcNAc transferase